MKNFYFDVTIHLADTDATGVIFFPKLFEKCVMGLEFFLEKNHLRRALAEHRVLFPVVQAHAQYFTPIRLYDELKVELTSTRVGQTSITLSYKFIDKNGFLAAEATLVHVCVDSKGRQKKDLSDEWKEAFNSIRHKGV